MAKKTKRSAVAKPAQKPAGKGKRPKWKAAPPALVAAFEQLVGALPGAQLRKMFGYPAGFVNGHMFAGVFQDQVFVRVGPEDHEQLLSQDGAAPFEPMPGRPSKESIVLPPSVVASEAKMREWIARALAHAAGLPPKAKR
ncbi:MAG TPA: TfoX/Sxy family protein [Gemmataceae bacterium]|nr:TfoX/Sxy family protein [Gemmataceae bacterium]